MHINEAQPCVLFCIYEPLAVSLCVINWRTWPLSTERNVFCKFHTSINEMPPQSQDSQALVAAAVELVIWFVMNIPLTSLTNGYNILCPNGKQISSPLYGEETELAK